MSEALTGDVSGDAGGEAFDLSETLNPADPKRFRDATILPIFERMRAETPVHYCAESPYGPFWSIMRYKDIMAIDRNHEVFSSEALLGGIMIDDAIVGDEDSDFFVKSFITMDPPDHGPQRKAVNRIVAPASLANFEKLIRGRTRTLLDSLPVGEEFDWVDSVSIELTTMMLATLFDFPFEDRRKLTRWSDVTTAEPDSPIVGSQEQRVSELMECLEYFKRLKAERRNGPAKPGSGHHACPGRGHRRPAGSRVSRQPHAADRRRQRHHPQHHERQYQRVQSVPGSARAAAPGSGTDPEHDFRGGPLADAAGTHAPHGGGRLRNPRSTPSARATRW